MYDQKKLQTNEGITISRFQSPEKSYFGTVGFRASRYQNFGGWVKRLAVMAKSMGNVMRDSLHVIKMVCICNER
jgi:hypothetical protein